MDSFTIKGGIYVDKIVVIGAGVMGSALAIHLGNNGHKVNLWGTQWDTNLIDQMISSKRHKGLGVSIPDTISFYYHGELKEALNNTKLVIIATISKGMESIGNSIAPYIKENHIILIVTKGIDKKNLCTMSTVIKNSLSKRNKNKVAIIKLGGPIIAIELAEGKYTEGIFASKDIMAAEYARKIFKSTKFKGGITNDILGVDLCAAFKNSYAIAMGIIEGVEGDTNNPKAALMARGTIEMANIVEAYGGKRETALGIAGVGDYYVTAQAGRNGKFGYLLGQGNTINKALEIMGNQTVEGLPVTLNGYRFLENLEKQGKINIKKDTPLFLELYNILYKNKPAEEGIRSYWLSG